MEWREVSVHEEWRYSKEEFIGCARDGCEVNELGTGRKKGRKRGNEETESKLKKKLKLMDVP